MVEYTEKLDEVEDQHGWWLKPATWVACAIAGGVVYWAWAARSGRCSQDRGAVETIACRAVLVAAAILLLPAPSQAGEARPPSIVGGEAAAVDGDTLVVDGHRVQIRALHAPELDELGGAAARDMAALAILGEHVICTVVDTDRFERLLVDCSMSSDGADFAEVVIRAGHAAHCPAHGRPDLASLPDRGIEPPVNCR
jgi:hypothetical protein